MLYLTKENAMLHANAQKIWQDGLYYASKDISINLRGWDYMKYYLYKMKLDINWKDNF